MQEVFSYLSKFEFVFIFFFISLIFMFAGFFLKKIKIINLIFTGIFFALAVIELILAITNSPLLVKGKAEDIYYLNNLNTKKIRHLKIFGENDKFFIDDVNRDTSKFIPNNSNVVFDVEYEIYNNNFRYTQGNSNSKVSIIFLGCSVVFGHGIGDNQTLPYYFSKKYDFKYNVLNFAVGGMGTNLALNIFNSNIINKFITKESKVKYFIYTIIDDHIERSFRTSSFNFAEDNYTVVDGKLNRVKEPLGIFKIVFKKSYVFNNYFFKLINNKNRKFYEQYLINNVLKMKRLAKEKYNAELIVILWPDIEQQLIERLKNEDINVIVLDKKFENDEYKIKNDGHPNGKANEEIAQILFDYINNDKL